MSDRVVSAARSFIGVKYRHQGRDPLVSLDCAGLIASVMKSLDLPYNDLKGYPRTPYKGMIKSVLDNQPRISPASQLEAGCILLLRIKRDPQHIAIFTGGTIIHSLLAVGKVTEHRFDDRWEKRVIQAYKIDE